MSIFKDSTWQHYTALLILLEGFEAATKRPELRKRVLCSEFWLQPFGGVSELKECLLADHKESSGYSDKDIPKAVCELLRWLELGLSATPITEDKAQEFFAICSQAREECRSIAVDHAWPEE